MTSWKYCPTNSACKKVQSSQKALITSWLPAKIYSMLICFTHTSVLNQGWIKECTSLWKQLVGSPLFKFLDPAQLYSLLIPSIDIQDTHHVFFKLVWKIIIWKLLFKESINDVQNIQWWTTCHAGLSKCNTKVLYFFVSFLKQLRNHPVLKQLHNHLWIITRNVYNPLVQECISVQWQHGYIPFPPPSLLSPTPLPPPTQYSMNEQLILHKEGRCHSYFICSASYFREDSLAFLFLDKVTWNSLEPS